MKKIVSLLLIFITFTAFAQKDNYQFYLNLNKVENDKLHVTLKTPEVKANKIIYNIPKIVPGSYDIDNYGQYITEFKAFDKDGKPLDVMRIDKNRWEIDHSQSLSKITYWVEDTWDADVEDFVFEPCGTNIEKGENFVLNNHGFFGYFDGMKNYKYEINVTHPELFYGSTGLTALKINENTDQYTTENYMDLVDAPIMYNIPDTTFFKIGDTDILISVYSKNKIVTSEKLATDIKSILELQKDYLGALPVKKYAFIIYIFTTESDTITMGALEHSYSSFYHYVEMPIDEISANLVGTAAHEFFHIVTPLNIHSEEIGDFDYINPKMSKHLWMYEGVTEYFSDHVKVYGGMITPEDYLKVIKDKLYETDQYNDTLPFTELSKGCLDKYEDQYGNVYVKGALIGLCLDILLREGSEGKIGMKDIMNKLSEEYGKHKSFKDEVLFDKIAEFSSAEIRTFFRKYVEGSSSLPLKEVFEKVGVNFKQNETYKSITFGCKSLNYNQESERFCIVAEGMDDFAKDLAYKINDELVSVNGMKLTMTNVQEVFGKYKQNTKVGDKVKVVVARKENNVYKIIKLKAKARNIEKTRRYSLKFNENASDNQLQLRKAWLGQK